jgi:hypothetical protein
MLQVWIWPAILCKLGPFSTALNINVSVLTLVAITFDRFYVINYPLRNKLTKKKCLLLIGLIWLISLLTSGYKLINYHVNVYNETEENESVYLVEKCEIIDTSHSEYQQIALFTIQYILPFIALTLAFAGMFKKIHKQTELNSVSNASSNSMTNKTKVLLDVSFFLAYNH